MSKLNEIYEQFECVSEMSGAEGGLLPLDASTISEITAGDDDPRFATFVIESGWSKSRRFWGPELFHDVAEQINDPSEAIVGYQGHIKPDDHGYAFPDIQLQWVKAKVIQSGEKAKLAVKAYVLPGTKARDYLKRNLVKTVSWRGRALETPYEKGVRVSKFAIESIDLSRPRAAGMSARLVGGLTSEMEEGSNSVKPEEIAALQANELRAHNPTLVSEIENAARTPVQAELDELKPKAESTESTLSKIRLALGISEDADILEVVGALAAQMKAAAKTVRDEILSSVIERKFKDDGKGTSKLVKAALASEMSTLELKGTEESRKDDEKLVEEMVNNFIDRDDDLKALVSEMEQTPATPPSTSKDRSGEIKPGYQSSNLRVKAAS